MLIGDERPGKAACATTQIGTASCRGASTLLIQLLTNRTGHVARKLVNPGDDALLPVRRNPFSQDHAPPSPRCCGSSLAGHEFFQPLAVMTPCPAAGHPAAGHR